MTDGPDSRCEVSQRPIVSVRLAYRPWRAVLPDARMLLERTARATLAAAARAGAVPIGAALEVSFMLANDARVRRLNRDYRGQDKPTNVLSFPSENDERDGESLGSTDGETGPRLLGDVVFALETLEREAAAQSKTLSDHLCHLAVHGVLHLLGYDHQDAEEAECMERLEVEVLASLGIGDPYREAPVHAAALDGATP